MADLPPKASDVSGLSSLLTHLASPRGERKLEALLVTDDPAAAVAALPAVEIFELVHEIGFDQARDLIALITPAQLQTCLDLDVWDKDLVTIDTARPWLTALVAGEFEHTGVVWAGLDAELRALLLQRMASIQDVSNGADIDDSEGVSIYVTPDRWFAIGLRGTDDDAALTMKLIEDLYRADADLARHTIMCANSEAGAELEETCYRWRAGRMADDGYVDFYDALEIFRPIELSALRAPAHAVQPPPPPHEGTASYLPIAAQEELLRRSFLARAVEAYGRDHALDGFEVQLAQLINRVLAAGRAKPGQADLVRRAALYATSTVSLALESAARSDVQKAADLLHEVALLRLFQAGYTMTVKLARLARPLVAKAARAGAPSGPMIEALASPRPFFARAADQPPKDGLRPFEALADLVRATDLLAMLAARVRIAELLGVDPATTTDTNLDDAVRTFVVRAHLDPAPTPQALSVAELDRWHREATADGHLRDAAQARALSIFEGLVARSEVPLTPSQTQSLIAGWLADLDAIAAVAPPIDARFVTGVRLARADNN